MRHATAQLRALADTTTEVMRTPREAPGHATTAQIPAAEDRGDLAEGSALVGEVSR
ncbi:MAG: hypothetical protein ACT4NY_21795 [Pseudonocardiales bacterium]